MVQLAMQLLLLFIIVLLPIVIEVISNSHPSGAVTRSPIFLIAVPLRCSLPCYQVYGLNGQQVPH